MQVSGVKLYVSHTRQTQDRDRDTKGTIQTEIEILQAQKKGIIFPMGDYSVCPNPLHWYAAMLWANRHKIETLKCSGWWWSCNDYHYSVCTCPFIGVQAYFGHN